MKNRSEFATKDIQIAACLLASGYELCELKPFDTRTYIFIFSIDEVTANEISTQHWNSSLLIPSKKLLSAFGELKTRLYSGRSHVA